MKSTILMSPFASIRPSQIWSTCLWVILSAKPVNALVIAETWTFPCPSLSKTWNFHGMKLYEWWSGRGWAELGGSLLPDRPIWSLLKLSLYLEAFIKVIIVAWVGLLRNLPKHWEKVVEWDLLGFHVSFCCWLFFVATIQKYSKLILMSHNLWVIIHYSFLITSYRSPMDCSRSILQD